jgi:N-hydroxyarylamine O-acetyltransferase
VPDDSAPRGFGPAEVDHYLARIGYSGSRHPTLATLRAIHARHAATVPFENLDVVLGVPVDHEPAALVKKLVHGHRGGHCAETNGLLRLALEALGFRVSVLTGRTRWRLPAGFLSPRTHVLLRVDLQEHAYLVDVGFPGMMLTAPLRLDTNEEQQTPHEPHRVIERGAERVLQAKVSGTWEDVCQFTFEEAHAIDVDVAMFYMCRHPDSFLANNLMVARADGQGTRYLVFNGEFRVKWGDRAESRQLVDSTDFVEVMAEHFGIAVPSGARLDSLPWWRS